MVLSCKEKTTIQDAINFGSIYANLVSIAALEDHNCKVHKVKESCDIRDSVNEGAQFALEEFHASLEKILPFQGCKLE